MSYVTRRAASVLRFFFFSGSFPSLLHYLALFVPLCCNFVDNMQEKLEAQDLLDMLQKR